MSTLLNAKMEQQNENAITAFKNQNAKLQEMCAKYKAILTSRDKEIEEPFMTTSSQIAFNVLL